MSKEKVIYLKELKKKRDEANEEGLTFEEIEEKNKKNKEKQRKERSQHNKNVLKQYNIKN